MQSLITELNREEVLRYLGYQGTTIPETLNQLIDRCIQTTLQTVTPKYLYRRFSIEKTDQGVCLVDTPLVLTGKSIAEHLENCREIYLLCVTVGFEIEKLIRLKMLTAPEEGVIFDSCASTAVEALADFCNVEIVKEADKQKLNTTWRFSPGYGDLPLTTQRPILQLMDAHRKIGLSLNESLLLTPNKSVTAIIGLTDSRKDPRKNKCDFCNHQQHCAFRKRGTQC